MNRLVTSVVSNLFGDLQRDPPPPTWNYSVLPPGGVLTTGDVGYEASRKVGRAICHDLSRNYDGRNNSCTSSSEDERPVEIDPVEHQKLSKRALREAVKARAHAMHLGTQLTDTKCGARAEYTLYSESPGEWYVKMLEREAINTPAPPRVSAMHPYDEWRRKTGVESALVQQKDFESAMSKIAQRMIVIVSGNAPEDYVINSAVITDDFIIDSQCTYMTAARDSIMYWTEPRTIGRKTLAQFRQHLYSHCRRSKEIGDWMEMLISTYYLHVEYEPDADYVQAAEEFCATAPAENWRQQGTRTRGAPKNGPPHPFHGRKVRVGRLVVKQTMVNLLHFYNVSATATVMLEGKTIARNYQEAVHRQTQNDYGAVTKFMWNALYPTGDVDPIYRTETYSLDAHGLAQPAVTMQPRLPDPKEWYNSIAVPVLRLKRRHVNECVYEVFGEDPWIMRSNVEFAQAFDAGLRAGEIRERIIKPDDPYHTILVPQEAEEAYLRASVQVALNFPWTYAKAFGAVANQRQAHRLESTLGAGSRNPFDAIYPACTNCGPDLRITIPLGTEYYQRKEEPGKVVAVDGSVGKMVSFAFLADAQVTFLYQVRPSAAVSKRKEMRIYGLRFKVESQVLRKVLVGLLEQTHEHPQIARSQSIARQLLDHAL